MAASQVKSQVIVLQGLLSIALLFGGGCDNSTNERELPKEPTKTTPAVISQTTTLSVEGMVCDACAQSIHEALMKIKGVQQCDASFEKKNATVVYAKDSVQPGQLVAVINELGYTATLTPPPTPAPQQKRAIKPPSPSQDASATKTEP